ncbi:MAG: hypothetical protein ACOCWQ_02575 [Nanoarchaeota archaeon]
MNRRAEGPSYKSGGPTLILVTLLVIMYIILLPPDAREELLGDPVTDIDDGISGDIPSVGEETEFVFAGPGRVDVASRDAYDHDIAAIHLSSRTDAKVIHASNPFQVKYTVFEHKPHQITFSVDDPGLVDNPIITFSATRHSGTLTITLNGHQIFSGDISAEGQAPIRIPDGLLLERNIMIFDVESPGWAFWSSNVYSIQNLRIQADVSDVSRQKSTATFSLGADEVHALKEAKLRFLPECQQLEVGRVAAYLNGDLVADRIPDCGVFNTYILDHEDLRRGNNRLDFELSEGNALLDRMEILTNIDEEANDVTYYFDLDSDLFSFRVEAEHVCGEIDGVCPDRCDEDVDKDCCFEEYHTAFWCDVPTQNSDDRCVGNVRSGTIFRCPSGYEDEHGDIPDGFEGICGDDEDGECPTGCSRFYDRDCCLEEGSGRYWCEDLPLTGLSDACRDDLDADSCRFCPSGYEGEDSDPQCDYDTQNPQREDVVLKERYEVTAEFIFVDDGQNKEAEVIVNGYRTNFDTFDDTYERDISEFVKDGSNYISIRPQSDFSLVEVRIDVDQAS